MKKGLLFLLLVSSLFTQAQSLKDALFSGKLKTDSGTVIRKDDDLSSKIDTAQKVAPAQSVETTAPVSGTEATQSTPAENNAAVSTMDNSINNTATTNTTAPDASAAPKNNTMVWKTYMDSVASTLKTEALSSKKVKHGDYFVLVTYTIGTDGQTEVSDVSVSPENGFLQQQIKARLDSDTPRLSPVLNGAGTPRKAIKKYSFTLSKE